MLSQYHLGTSVNGRLKHLLELFGEIITTLFKFTYIPAFVFDVPTTLDFSYRAYSTLNGVRELALPHAQIYNYFIFKKVKIWTNDNHSAQFQLGMLFYFLALIHESSNLVIDFL